MIATNNIFNIRATKGGQWLGQVGTKKGFVEFDTREHAIRAWLVLMRTYRKKYHLRTIRDIVTRFAPPSENNTEAYVNYCAKRVYLSAATPLSPATNDYARLGCAMAKMETDTDLTAIEILKVQQKFGITI